MADTAAKWLVVRQVVNGGRGSIWLLVDTDGSEATVTAKSDDPSTLRAMAAVLNGADAVYRAELRRNPEPF